MDNLSWFLFNSNPRIVIIPEIDVIIGFYDGPPINNDIIGLYSINLAPGHIEKVTTSNTTDDVEDHAAPINSDIIGLDSMNMAVGQKNIMYSRDLGRCPRLRCH